LENIYYIDFVPSIWVGRV